MIDIPCITLILSKIGKSLLNFPLSIFVIRLDSLRDSHTITPSAMDTCSPIID